MTQLPALMLGEDKREANDCFRMTVWWPVCPEGLGETALSDHRRACDHEVCPVAACVGMVGGGGK